MLRIYRFAIISFLLFFFSCTKDGPIGPQGPQGPQGIQGTQGSNGSSDKQIRFQITNTLGGITDTSGFVYGTLFKFNRANYPGVDSALFLAQLRTDSISSPCIVSLYNLTDSTIIPNSTLISSSTSFEWVQSGNILSALPQKEIDLAVLIRASHQGTMAQIGANYLFLMRN